MVFKSSVSKHFFLKKYFLSIYTVVLPSNLTNEYLDNFLWQLCMQSLQIDTILL